jgi:NADPH2:quinone reductase
MAKAFGIRVITTVLNEQKAKEIAHLKADIVVDTSKENIVDVLKRQLDEGHPITAAIDCLGGDVMGKCIHFMEHGGRWIMIATLAGDLTQVDLRNVYVRNVRIIGSTLRSRKPEVKAQILAALVDNVWSKVETGEVKPTIYPELPITEAEAAHDLLYSGKSAGKVVLHIANE